MYIEHSVVFQGGTKRAFHDRKFKRAFQQFVQVVCHIVLIRKSDLISLEFKIF